MDGPTDSGELAFLALFLADRAADRRRPLAEYLALFPGCEAGVARRWLETQVEPDPARTRSAPAATALGTRRLGRYELVRELGRGGQGAVHLARDVELGRWVALKVVPKLTAGDDLTPRLQREARALSRLEREDVCALYDVGHDDDAAWIAMRYVEGRTLAAEIESWRTKGEPPPLARALELGERIARALHAAHASGLVHRDVKPQNVMITPDGAPVLLDFGIARPDEGGAPLTRSGEALGTPAYLAPEVLNGARPANARTDVWALGVTLYELVTLRRPFEAPTREALVRRILTREPPDPRGLQRGLPRDLAVVLATALAKEPVQRYATALDLAEDLRRVRAREPIRARPTPAPVLLWRWASRRPALAGSLAALFVVLLGGLAITSLLLGRTRELLTDFTQLADQRIVRELSTEAGTLWPAVPERAGDMRDWLERAAQVLGRRGGHERALAAVQNARTNAGRAELPEATNDWMREQLTALLDDLDELAVTRERMADRLAFALSVEQRTLVEPADRWRAAIERVAADERFEGFALTPQRGLVPLGPDPQTHLEEFALIATGDEPARDPDTGALVIAPGMAMVFVLVPGGETTVGADLPTPERPVGSPYVDPGRRAWDGPTETVRLDPFLISRFEMTQGQWSRHTHANPSYFRAESRWVEDDLADLHPVEQVSYSMARTVLPQLGLELPTEVQWEHAARGGTTTVWYTGDDVHSLQGHVNLSDAYAHTHEGNQDWEWEPWLDDGHTAHAPIGSYLPNPFGLNDVLGNVSEWCLDSWEDLADVTARPGDGLRIGQLDLYCVRGGSHTSPAWAARCAYRDGYPPYMTFPYVGVRPVFVLQ